MVRRRRLPRNIERVTQKSVFKELNEADKHSDRLVEQGRALQKIARED